MSCLWLLERPPDGTARRGIVGASSSPSRGRRDARRAAAAGERSGPEADDRAGGAREIAAAGPAGRTSDPEWDRPRPKGGPAGDDPAAVADFILSAGRGRDGSPPGRRRRVAGEGAEDEPPTVELDPEAERAATFILAAGKSDEDDEDEAVRRILAAGR